MSLVEEKQVSEELHSLEAMPAQPLAVPPKRGAHGVTGAVLLIGLGAALLLSNLGVITLSLAALLPFWPVILILVGLDVMLSGRSAGGSVLAALISIAIVFGVIFWIASNPTPVTGRAVTTQPVELPLDAAVKTLEVEMDLGIGNTTLDVLESSEFSVQGQYRANQGLPFEASSQRAGDRGIVTLRQGDEDGGNFVMPTALVSDLTLALTNALPVILDVNAGMGELDFDLTGLQLDGLTLDAGMGNIQIALPEVGGYEVTIDAGMGNVEISLPDEVEARIFFDSGLGDLDIADRFEEVSENVWQTAGYQENAENSVLMTIEAGMGNVEIND